MSDQPRIVSIDITHLVRALLADLDPDDGHGTRADSPTPEASRTPQRPGIT